MTEYKINPRMAMLLLLMLSCTFVRIIPHFPNLSPITSIGIFSAAYFTNRWLAFLWPLFICWTSDLLINNFIYSDYFHEFTWFYEGCYWQYLSYILIIFMSLGIVKKVSPKRIIGAVMLSSAIFFLVSNFGCWLGSDLYPKSMNGLIACYVAGIPFLKGTLIGDLCYSGVLFGVFALTQHKYSSIVSDVK